jgi:hypothetical protein
MAAGCKGNVGAELLGRVSRCAGEHDREFLWSHVDLREMVHTAT